MCLRSFVRTSSYTVTSKWETVDFRSVWYVFCLFFFLSSKFVPCYDCSVISVKHIVLLWYKLCSISTFSSTPEYELHYISYGNTHSNCVYYIKWIYVHYIYSLYIKCIFFSLLDTTPELSPQWRTSGQHFVCFFIHSRRYGPHIVVF